jgi:hypothetical protein
MKTYIIYTIVAMTMFYVISGEKDRMGRAVMRENVVVSGAYIPY